MRLIGAASPGLYLLDAGAGTGRLLHVREDELVLFQCHPLDPDMVGLVEPCDADETAEAERLAHIVLHRSQLAELRPAAVPEPLTAA